MNPGSRQILPWFVRVLRGVQSGEFSIVRSWVADVYDCGLGLGVVQFHVGFPGHVGLHGLANSGHSN